MNSAIVTIVTIGLPMLLAVLVMAILPFFLIGLGGWIYSATKKRLGDYELRKKIEEEAKREEEDLKLAG